MKDVLFVLDMQFGSTGKGQIAGTVGRMWEADTAVCANGPNAGHTYRWTTYDNYDTSEHKIVHMCLPVGAVLPSVRNILLGPGASFDLAQLQKEIRNPDIGRKRLIIHPNAAVVLDEHRKAEQAFVRVGSTMKGTAEAVIEKMRRTADASIARNWRSALREIEQGGTVPIIVDYDEYDRALDESRKLLVEGAQGASLSMHSQFYPYCTSRDVSTAQVWADCRLPHDHTRLFVIGTARTFPIRVANRFDAEGRQVGTSGGFYPDQQEIQWADLGREPELTTVTKLPRRIFTFSVNQIIESTRYVAPDFIALTFCDYVQKEYGEGVPVSTALQSYIRRTEQATGKRVEFLSFGPLDTDLYDYHYTNDGDSMVLVRPELPWQDYAS